MSRYSPFEIKSLQKMVREFVRMVAALIVVAGEEAINAVLSTIKKALEATVGTAIPI